MKKTIKIKVKDETEMSRWFEDNYSTLGFDSIIKKNKNSFPDFIMQQGKKQLRVELETITSNFIRHKHDINKVDVIVCIVDDLEEKLDKKFIILSNILIFKRNPSIIISRELRNKLMKMKYDLGVDTAEEVIQRLIIIAGTINSADNQINSFTNKNGRN